MLNTHFFLFNLLFLLFITIPIPSYTLPIPMLQQCLRGRKSAIMNSYRLLSSLSSSSSVDISGILKQQSNFLNQVAKVEPIPKRFADLLELLRLQDSTSQLVEDPRAIRKNLNPFLVPIAVSKKNNSEEVLGYLRWPKEWIFNW